MQKVLVSKVELSDDCEHLYLTTDNYEDCNCLWSKLFGQVNDNTEGRKPILYNFPVYLPDDLIMEVESDPKLILSLVEYLEITSKAGNYLPEGTAEKIRKQIAEFEKASANANTESNTQSVESPPEQDDDYKTTPSCK